MLFPVYICCLFRLGKVSQTQVLEFASIYKKKSLRVGVVERFLQAWRPAAPGMV